MSLIADGLLIATCLTAAVYCFVLGRRLKQFSNTEVGVGQQIVQLNKTLEDTRTALRESQAGAKAEAETLAREVVAARKLVSQLRSYTEVAKDVAPPSGATSAPTSTATSDAPPMAKRQVLEAAAAVAIDLEAGANQDESVEEATQDAEEDIDPAEIDVNALLAASAGEQQLGFLPDEVEGTEGDEPEEDVAQDDGSEIGEESTDADLPEEVASADGEDNAGNLLQVERMAL